MRKLKSKILFIAFAASGCAGWPTSPPASSIDAAFRLRRTQTPLQSAGQSTGVRSYQKWVSPVLGSECKYYPSDSHYHVLVSRQCGPFTATAKSMSRFMLEYDAPKLGFPVVLKQGHIHYQDLPGGCGVF